ncbi:hypothetical protein M9H77_25345 [Catharanthus roseus]|uniref:Uncharacterized protein n=1 Tax=Catharanthus roseus TaxID=4058 RepID=A0ACC0A9B3_CATRO|nr:hypothetical protein M9H77_25345 [Catharanthus roseus]
MLEATRQDSSCSTHGYSHADYGVSSSDHYVSGTADRVPEGDRVFREEQERRGDDGGGDGGDSEGGDSDGDGGDDDHNDGDDDGDEEQPVYVAPVAPASGSDGRPRQGKGKGLTGSLMSVMSKFAGSRNKRPDVVRDVPVPTQKRKKVKSSDWEQTKAAEGGPVNLELIPSYGGHVAGRIWRGQDRGLLKCRSRYMVLTSWELTDSQAGLLASGLWPLLRDAWIYLYFTMFSPPFRHSPEGCKPYMQISYKSESKLLDIRLRLDMMTADEVQWMLYRTQDVRDCWVSTWHGFIAYFDCLEPYMPDWVLRHLGRNADRLTRMYDLQNTFVETLWFEAPSHLLIETWTSVPAIPASLCTDYYLDWYLPRTHPRIQNPENIPSGYNVPVAPAMPPHTLLHMIARECHRQDISSDEFRHRVRDLLMVHYNAL